MQELTSWQMLSRKQSKTFRRRKVKRPAEIRKKGEKLTGLSSRQKKDLANGVGLADMKVELGYVNTKLGFNGYGSQPTKNTRKASQTSS